MKILRNYLLYSRIIISFAFIFIFISCRTTRNIEVLNTEKYINYTKVRISIKSKDINQAIKGYFFITIDSLVCFRFWGPLGFEIGKGQISDQFRFYDAINKREYADFRNLLENSCGLILDKNTMINLLIGKIDLLTDNILQLNGSIVKVLDRSKHSLALIHQVSQREIEINYKFNQNYPGVIQIRIKDKLLFFEIKFQILDISNKKMICNF